jgi:hypothetical protein
MKIKNFEDLKTASFIDPIETNEAILTESGLVYNQNPIINNGNLDTPFIPELETGGMNTDFSGSSLESSNFLPINENSNSLAIDELLTPVTGENEIIIDPTNSNTGQTDYTFGTDSDGFTNLTKEELDKLNKLVDSGEVTLEDVKNTIKEPIPLQPKDDFVIFDVGTRNPANTGGGGGNTFQTDPTSTGAGAGDAPEPIINNKYLIWGVVGSLVLIILFAFFNKKKK